MAREIKWSDNDTRLVRHIRECLRSKSVNLVLLDELLTRLEGKIFPSDGEQKKRIAHSHCRVARHMQQLTGSRRA